MRWDGSAAISQRRRCVRAFACLCGMLFGLFVGEVGCAGAASGTVPYEDAVTYCRGNVMIPIALSDDRSILCFDGYIVDNIDFSPVEKLKENGLFVVRSRGGYIEQSIALARLVHDRNAIVVVYDYCESACAVYLLMATDQAVVRRDSLVTWHFRSTGLSDCFVYVSAGDDRPQALRATLCDTVPERYRAYGRRMEALSTEYLRTRTIAPDVFGNGLDAPESDHVREILKSILDETGEFSNVFWTWNPRYYKAVFKTNVLYEAYPESQAEVDTLSARFGLDRVIFDP